jgi:hypothetical protein
VAYDISRVFLVAAVTVVLIAAVFLGMVIESNIKPNVQPSVKVFGIADITLVVQGDWILGPDNKTHDAFVPYNFTVFAGQKVNMTFENFDDMPHTFVSPALGVTFQIPGSQTAGVPEISQYQFTEATPGIYRWWCSVPCDSDAGGWAMTTGSDGQPGQIGYMGGFVTVLAD